MEMGYITGLRNVFSKQNISETTLRQNTTIGKAHHLKSTTKQRRIKQQGKTQANRK